jgi:hypothetical protein
MKISLAVVELFVISGRTDIAKVTDAFHPPPQLFVGKAPKRRGLLISNVTLDEDANQQQASYSGNRSFESR